ncbi:hypothetical protein GWI33_013967 [Rhynchophorus ferrugineus]|uniref:Uncharacterized protein n=1 Tax=Rhynchophorus ferrugineus TaxID=354439 RepID=A0A834M7B6_RHYFE|nr:hypothetical protein GWI33_013967 [Rhynchophorus ferrugineus]
MSVRFAPGTPRRRPPPPPHTHKAPAESSFPAILTDRDRLRRMGRAFLFERLVEDGGGRRELGDINIIFRCLVSSRIGFFFVSFLGNPGDFRASLLEAGERRKYGEWILRF